MKKLTLLLICSSILFAFQVNAQEFKIDSMITIEGFDANFQLENVETSEYKGNLNCQSFIKKLDFYNSSSQLIIENYISMDECRAVFETISECLAENKPKCFKADDILNKDCECH